MALVSLAVVSFVEVANEFTDRVFVFKVVALPLEAIYRVLVKGAKCLFGFLAEVEVNGLVDCVIR
jgi:hypothetical protein